MMKRGQITVYMIVGVVILISVVSLLYFKNYISENIVKEKQVEITSVPEQFKDIQTQIQDCTDQFTLNLIYALGINGGYLYRDNLTMIDYQGLNITYLHYGKTNYMPSAQRMEMELSQALNTLLPYNCRLINESVDINFGNVVSSVDILDNNINVAIKWPIKLTKGSVTSDITDINLNYPIRLGEIRNIVDEMIKQQIIDKLQLCITCMARTAQQNDLFVNTYNQDDSVIFIITDLKEVKDFDLYRFEYAGDYK